jgi:hypothetical protein
MRPSLRAAGPITAEEVHASFAEAIKSRPVPDISLCAELAEQINEYRLWAVTRDPVLDFVYSAVRDARRLVGSLGRLKQGIGGRPWPNVDALLDKLATFDNECGGVRPSVPNSAKWPRYASTFTPHIEDTLRKAGWRTVSSTSALGPVIAVLSLAIGAVTGEVPDNYSLSRTLRQAAIPKTRRKSSSKPSDAAGGSQR